VDLDDFERGGGWRAPFEAWDDPDYQPILAPTIDINSSSGLQVEGFLDVAHFAWAHVESFGDRSDPVVPSYKVELTPVVPTISAP
jgi:hypothetical protein